MQIQTWLMGMALAGAMALLPSAADADATIFSDLGTGGSYDCCQSSDVSGSGSSEGFYFAVGSAFTSPGAYNVTQIDIAVGHLDGTNQAEVGLWTNSGGLPGAELGSWAVSNQPDAGSTSTTLATVSNITGVHLAFATRYFVTVSPGAPDTLDRANLNSLDIPGLNVVDLGSGYIANPNQTLYAFDVLGRQSVGGPAIPEPGTLALVGIGGSALRLIRRRQAARRVTFPDSPGHSPGGAKGVV